MCVIYISLCIVYLVCKLICMWTSDWFYNICTDGSRTVVGTILLYFRVVCMYNMCSILWSFHVLVHVHVHVARDEARIRTPVLAIKTLLLSIVKYDVGVLLPVIRFPLFFISFSFCLRSFFLLWRVGKVSAMCTWYILYNMYVRISEEYVLKVGDIEKFRVSLFRDNQNIFDRLSTRWVLN